MISYHALGKLLHLVVTALLQSKLRYLHLGHTALKGLLDELHIRWRSAVVALLHTAHAALRVWLLHVALRPATTTASWPLCKPSGTTERGRYSQNPHAGTHSNAFHCVSSHTTK